MYMVLGTLKGLDTHDSIMDEARPNSEPDKAEMLEWVARCHNEKHTERRVNPNNHQWVVRVPCVPSPVMKLRHTAAPFCASPTTERLASHKRSVIPASTNP